MDSQVHNNALAEENDKKRTKVLEELGYTVLRFENKMVFENLASVFMEIQSNFK